MGAKRSAQRARRQRVRQGVAVSDATKHDGGKLRLDLIPPEAMRELAKVLTFGAGKYGDRNWEAGITWGRVYAALQRHLLAWWSREGGDDETGLSHLSHALCCATFLATYEARGKGLDDRPALVAGYGVVERGPVKVLRAGDDRIRRCHAEKCPGLLPGNDGCSLAHCDDYARCKELYP